MLVDVVAAAADDDVDVRDHMRVPFYVVVVSVDFATVREVVVTNWRYGGGGGGGGGDSNSSVNNKNFKTKLKTLV